MKKLKINEKVNFKGLKLNKQGSIRIIALALSSVMAISVLSACGKKTEQKETTTTTIVSIDDLGMTEEFPTNSQYGNTSGDVKKEDIVEKDGVYYADKESADKSNKVGKTEIDTQNGKLEVKPNGTVVEKETGFEVKDEKGEVVTKGDNEEDLLKDYITLDKNYYYKDGSLAFKKGDKVNKDDFNRVKHLLTTDPKQATATTQKQEPTTQKQEPTTQKQEPTTQKQEPTTVSSQGVVNKNGTYTIYGTTYMDKATFEAFILDPNSDVNFGFYNGVIYPKAVINEMTNNKTK